ncbi:dicarboxylate/amino acid:cation symporter [uncultured Odoribacter sp.]|uniref:dicarboxylate/amino acid:cation symporter n=1 Tax=uncultured Odoribacter sp. TaxID=876416 RepID=UPI002605ADBF|nr:dicarboxylate/amino acid:cation symporter [uncultured Odoribacter sp.]
MIHFLKSTIFKLLLAVFIGIFLGFVVGEGFMNVVVTVKYILGQLIFFMVPLIILGFVSSSIAKMKGNASGMLGSALGLAYLSSVGAAFFAMFLGYWLIPLLSIKPATEGLKEIPALVFRLDIPPVMSVMTALVLSVMIGLATVWTKSGLFVTLLDHFQKMVLLLINRILIPVLPFFIAANFCALSYEGAITRQLPIFIGVMGIVLIAHFIWLTFLYLMAGAFSRKNPWQVLKYYGPAYFTAVGTMSSAATLAVALKCARKSPVLKGEVVDFAIPLFSNVHLCGSILTEVFFVMTVSLLLYGTLPAMSVMVVFILLLGIFAIGAPGVPGGTVIASLGIVISVLGFNEAGTALLLTIFALQDSFGTACNITGDGALTLILTKIESKLEIKTQQKTENIGS